MKTKYEIKDIYGKDLLGVKLEQYNAIIQWAYVNSDKWELVKVKTDYTYNVPSQKIISFIFTKIVRGLK